MKEDGLLKILAQRPRSVSQLSKELGIRREFLAGYLEALRDNGTITRILVGRSWVYMPATGTESSLKTIQDTPVILNNESTQAAKMSEEEEE
ncbi:MAG: helix-turn-helix transcriptional regulator [Candidatus Aenigmarchaeota archaeon]|nr:helix-turn-helix transcriptional regulator [Candidatus Aenigmarchaeota archaeon]